MADFNLLMNQFNDENNVDALLQKLSDLPAPDYSNGININDLKIFNDYTFPDFSQTYPSPPQQNEFPLGWSQRERANSIAFLPTHRMSLPNITDFLTEPMLEPLDNIHNPPKITRRASIATTAEKTYFCSEKGCTRSFARLQNLRSHARCHLPTTPHNCAQCGLGFRRTTDLQRHVRTMHTPNELKPWGCPNCPKRFGRSDALKRHMAGKSKDNGCPAGIDHHLARELEQAKVFKRKKSLNTQLQTVLEL